MLQLGKKVILPFLFLLISPVWSGGISDYYGSFKVMAYYPDYASGGLPASSIRFDKLSHVIFFSIYPNSNGSLNYSEMNRDHLSSLVSLAHGRNTKVLICVGGWNLSSGFGPMAASPSARAAFIQNVKRFCLDYGLDGVDLDWEPVSTTSDRTNYTTLIQELKPVLTAANLTLSIAVFAQGHEFLPAATSSIDWIGIMAYDLGYPHSSYEGALSALTHWESFGIPGFKIVLGMPFYGRNQSGGYFAYKDIVAAYQPSPAMDFAGDISFNGINTIEKKTAYIVDNQYAGVMLWELTQDTIDSNSLLTASSRAFHINRLPDFNNDHQINLADLCHLVEFWLLDECSDDNAWCGRADLDASGHVALEDVAKFSAYW